ncbi:IgA Peptidase M64 OS=Streptomyces griseomycini OX=66895 GN=FHS37_002589 PE=4 SV=1 [Streptomyces griseomycini]
MSTVDGAVIGTTKIIDNGPASARWNLVIMGDGYKNAQLGQFANDVRSFVNNFLGSGPFNRVPTAINVYRVDVASTDSGADDPATPTCEGTGAVARTYFDASFCGDGLPHLLVVKSRTALAVAGNQVPEWNLVMVIVNTTKYGGSGGSVAVFSLADRATEIGLHEMCHTAFGLGDEYEFYRGCGRDTDRDRHPPIEPCEANITIDGNRTTNKWRDLIAANTRMPTTQNADCRFCDPQPNPVGAGTVGAFEGAHYYHCKAYRPQFTCRMRALRNPWCAVCERRIYQTLAPYVKPVVKRVAAVTRNSGRLDAFWAGRDAKLWTNWWDQAPGGGWKEHSPIDIPIRFLAPETSVAAVAQKDRLDVFWEGRDGKIFNNWAQAPGWKWKPLMPVPIAHELDFTVPPAPGTSIAAVVRTTDNWRPVDVFWTGTDCQIWSNRRTEAPGGDWSDHAPFPIAAEFSTLPAERTGIAAVSRHSNRLDVFWAGSDGQIWSTWWEQAPDMGWRDHFPFPIARAFSTLAAQRTGIAAVARNSNHLDVFWAGSDGQIWSTWWDRVPDMGWRDHFPFPIARAFSTLAAERTGIAAVARTSNHLDVFWAGRDGKIWTNWWTPGNDWKDHPPRPIASQFSVPPAPDTGIAAVARTSGNLDVFWTGTDGNVWTNWWTPGDDWKDHPAFTI